jgi:transposase
MKRPSYPSDLSDGQWKRIERLGPAPILGGRPVKHDRLAILNAILYLVRTGCAWRLLPHDMPSWKTVYHYFRYVKGFKLLPRRWVVERTFGWLGRHRRFSKDYQFLPATSEAIIYVAMIGLMIRRLAQE